MNIMLSLVLALLLIFSGCAIEPQTPTINVTSNVKLLHNDDIVGPLPGGGGIAYRANVHGPNEPSWPPLGLDTTFVGTVRLTYRRYIETLAGEVRNDFMDMDASAASFLDDPLNVTYNFVGLPPGVTVNQTRGAYGGVGPFGNHRQAHVLIQISIPSDLKPGEYAYAIHLEYLGTEFGVVPGVLKVLPAGVENYGAVYVPGKYLYVWGTTTSPVPDGAILAAELYSVSSSALIGQTSAVEAGNWSANFTLGKDGIPATLNNGVYHVNVWRKENPNVAGSVSFSLIPPPSLEQ